MTPQEKAKELFDKFIPQAKIFHQVLGYGDYHYSAKISALITVQEILNCNPHTSQFNTDVYSTYDYWFQVKLEIEKL